MRYIFFAAVLLFAAFGGEWVYLRYLRRLDPPGPQALALGEHFTRCGLTAQVRALRHGWRPAQVQALAGYTLAGHAEPVVVAFCTTEASAENRLRALGADPAVQALRNGRLVLSLPRGAASASADAVRAAFARFEA